MEKNRQHYNSQFIRIFKFALAIFAFGLPIITLANLSAERFKYFFSSTGNFFLFLSITIIPIPFILLATYFYTDLEVNNDGLLVDFLWYKLPVPWNKIIDIKPLFGLRIRNAGIYIVIVDALTPFHRLYGILYGFSLMPAFILWRSVNNFEILKNDIDKHLKQNRRIDQ